MVFEPLPPKILAIEDLTGSQYHPPYMGIL